MQMLKKNYDRVFALLVAVLTLFVSTSLIVKSFGVAGRFASLPVDRVVGDVPSIGDADGLALRVDAEEYWTPPTASDSGKEFRAFASTTVFWVDGKLVDAHDGPPIRGKVPNAWLLEHGLPIERDDVLAMDPDGDGFSNGEEFENGATDPKDGASHPDVLLKLSLADVVAEDWILLFASEAGGRASIRKLGDGGRGWFEVGDVLPGERHKLLGFNAASATIVEIGSGKQSVLKRRAKTNLPVYRAVFDYALDPVLLGERSFARGERFSIPRGGGECTVESLGLEAVTLSVVKPDGRSMTLRLER